MTKTLKIKKLDPRAIIPKYQTAGAACFDLHAIFNTDDGYSFVSVNTATTFKTGLAFEVPEGHVMLVYSRSGHGFNQTVRLANCVGVVDSDYRGEVKIKLVRDEYYGPELVVRHGDRIAQAMIIPVSQWAIEEVSELSDTVRGAKGFGSTGVKA